MTAKAPDIAQVRLCLARKATEKRPNHIVLCMVLNREDTGSWDRHLRHQGIDPSWRACRPMTATEIEAERLQYRIRSFRYDDWWTCIVDEWGISQNEEWCKELCEIGRVKWDRAKANAELAAQKEKDPDGPGPVPDPEPEPGTNQLSLPDRMEQMRLFYILQNPRHEQP